MQMLLRRQTTALGGLADVWQCVRCVMSRASPHRSIPKSDQLPPEEASYVSFSFWSGKYIAAPAELRAITLSVSVAISMVADRPPDARLSDAVLVVAGDINGDQGTRFRGAMASSAAHSDVSGSPGPSASSRYAVQLATTLCSRWHHPSLAPYD
jgi:hypothetical protein